MSDRCPKTTNRPNAGQTIAYSLWHPAILRVSNDQFESIKLAMRQLFECGYRRIGFALSSGIAARSNGAWDAGYVSQARQWKGKYTIPLLKLKNERSLKPLDRWLSRYEPDVVIGFSAIYDYLRLSGNRIPKDIGFADINCLSKNGPVSGIYQNSEIVGRYGAEMLIGALQNHVTNIESIPAKILVPGSWVAGSTLRKPEVNVAQ